MSMILLEPANTIPHFNAGIKRRTISLTGLRKLPENWARSAFHAVATSVGDKSPSIKSSRFMLETCFGLYASVEVSVAELYVWHRVLEW
jgi:hypothetical protein